MLQCASEGAYFSTTSAYYDVIKDPIDISRIQSKVKADEYSTVQVKSRKRTFIAQRTLLIVAY